MRYTVVDERGAVSFVASCESLNALVAACAENPTRLGQMLGQTRRFDAQLEDYVSCGLAVFDEHNVDGNHEAIHSALRHCQPHELPVFRVVDADTRRASLQPVKAGIVIFNLKAQRIIQVMNSYAEIRRRGKVVVRDDQGAHVYRYELPANWVIVP